MRLAALCGLLFGWVGCGPAQGTVVLDVWTLDEGTSAATQLRVPFHLNLPARPSFVLRTEVLLPAEDAGRELRVLMPWFTGLSELRVNGILVPSTTRRDTDVYAHRGSQAWAVPATVTSTRHLVLELTVRNRWQQSGWLDTAPRIVRADTIHWPYEAVRWLNEITQWFALGVLAQLFGTYLLIFIRRRQRLYLFLTISCLTGASYPAYMLGLMQPILGIEDVGLTGVLIPLATALNVYFAHEHFQLGKVPRFIPALVAIQVLVCLVFRNPFTSSVLTGTSATTVIELISVYLVWRLYQVARSRPGDGAGYMLASFMVNALTNWTDGMHWYGQTDVAGGLRLISASIANFSLLQVFLLSRHDVNTLKESERLNVLLAEQLGVLEGRQQEIRHLGTELRRQIADRSQQIFSALLALSGQAAAPRLASGEIVNAQYRVESTLETSPARHLYRAVRLEDQRPCVLELPGPLGSDTLTRLASDWRSTARVRLPHLAAVLDVDVDPRGMLYRVFEDVDGGPLSQRLPQLGPQARLETLRQIAEALAGLHEHGLTHGRLTLSLVLLASGAQTDVKLTGYVHPAGPQTQNASEAAPSEDSEHDTQILSGSATAGQRRGSVATPADDVYQLGVIARELLPAMDDSLRRLIDDCLSSDVQRRPTARMVMHALPQARVAP